MPIKPYTPTANINVTFGLAMVVFFVTQYQGFNRHGVRGYVTHLADPSGGAQGARPGRSTSSSFLVHLMGEFFKPLSLSVRLFGNTIAGHLIILVMLGLHAAVRQRHRDHPGRVCSWSS